MPIAGYNKQILLENKILTRFTTVCLANLRRCAMRQMYSAVGNSCYASCSDACKPRQHATHQLRPRSHCHLPITAHGVQPKHGERLRLLSLADKRRRTVDVTWKVFFFHCFSLVFYRAAHMMPATCMCQAESESERQ